MELVDRKRSASVKWEMVPEDVLPLWVADMDFKSPTAVTEALVERAKHGVFGYTYTTESYYDAIISWMEKAHNWKIKREWIIQTPGIVSALNFIIQSFSDEGDNILIQRPVYNPFFNGIEKNKRNVINSPLVLIENHYEIDFVDFEQKVRENNVKLFIMCSPHNPVGRVWTKDELIKIGDICLKYNVLIIIDEIHHDLVFKAYKHIPLASIDEKYSNISITCTAPSKTFNLAGLHLSNLIIENNGIRNTLNTFINKLSLSTNNIFGLIACEAAYKHGEEWLDSVIDYLEVNKKLVKDFVSENIPQVKVVENEATYLLWLDFRGLGMNNTDLAALINNKAKLWLNHGYIYGDEGSGFERINIACHRSILEKALIQLKHAIESLS